MKALEIIAKFYTLLSEFSSEDLAVAAAIADSPHLRIALSELAQAKSAMEASRPPRPEARRPLRRIEISEHAADRPIKNGIEARVKRVVLDPDVFKSNAEVAKFLSSLGLPVTFRGKDGRNIMLERLLDVLNDLDPEPRKKMLSKLFTVLPKNETTGWFEAIRGEGE